MLKKRVSLLNRIAFFFEIFYKTLRCFCKSQLPTHATVRKQRCAVAELHVASRASQITVKISILLGQDHSPKLHQVHPGSRLVLKMLPPVRCRAPGGLPGRFSPWKGQFSQEELAVTMRNLVSVLSPRSHIEKKTLASILALQQRLAALIIMIRHSVQKTCAQGVFSQHAH